MELAFFAFEGALEFVFHVLDRIFQGRKDLRHARPHPVRADVLGHRDRCHGAGGDERGAGVFP